MDLATFAAVLFKPLSRFMSFSISNTTASGTKNSSKSQSFQFFENIHAELDWDHKPVSVDYNLQFLITPTPMSRQRESHSPADSNP